MRITALIHVNHIPQDGRRDDQHRDVSDAHAHEHMAHLCVHLSFPRDISALQGGQMKIIENFHQKH